jgi:aminopeptidase N
MNRIILAVFLVLAAQVPLVRAQTDKGYEVYSYTATIKLDRQTDSMWGIVSMSAMATWSMPGILQHAKFLTIDSVIFFQDLTRNRVSITWLDTTTGAYLVNANVNPAHPPFSITTYYHGKGQTEEGSMHWGGITNSDTMMFAMGVGFNAPYTGCTRHWLPCYDLPDSKALFTDLTFICRESDITVSNGLLISNTVANGWRTMQWHESKPIATYLMMFATGPYVKSDISNSLNIPFEVYSLRRDSAEAALQMNVRVRDVLAFYDTLFGSYPFEKVGYVVTPIGSMEHQTMICLDKSVLTGDSAAMTKATSAASTVAVHELSHMWWGDRVTCKTFDDAWLNEGFAEYCESLALEHLFGRTQYIARQKSNIAGAKTSVLPLFGAPTVNNHKNNYPYETIYQKGAAVLGMLRQILGDSLFFRAVHYYGDQHAYSTATSLDLWHDFEHVTGQDLAWFFKPWVFATGYPKDTITWEQTPSGARITFHQVYNNDSARYFRLPIVVRGTTTGGLTKDVTLWMDSVQSTTVDAPFGFTPDAVAIDPEGMMLMRVVRTTKLDVPEPQSPTATGSLKVRFLQSHLYVDSDRPLGVVHIAVADLAGRIVRSADTTCFSNHLDQPLNVEGLANGQYCFKVFAGDQQTVLCTIIAR